MPKNAKIRSVENVPRKTTSCSWRLTFGSMPHALLFIHGFPHDGSLWEPQINDLSDVAIPIAPDLNGFGRNAGALSHTITMEEHARDLKMLLDERGIDRVVLCGLSMGGYIAMAFLDLFPDRVKGLILCNTRANADDTDGKKGREELAEEVMRKGTAVIARGMLPKMLSEHTRKERPEAALKIEAMMERQPPEGIAASSRGMAQRPDRTAWLKNVNVPTLIITGSADRVMELSTSTTMHEAIEGSRLVVIEEAGHLSNVDAPAEFNAAVREFLQRIPD